MKRFLLYLILLLPFYAYSTELNRIDSILVSKGYNTNLNNLNNDNYYNAWKVFGDRAVSIEIFGSNKINQIRVSHTVCPTLDSLSESQETKQIEIAKTIVIDELKEILNDQTLVAKLSEIKSKQDWKDSKVYDNKWHITDSGIELRYRYNNENKCDIYFDGFYVAIDLRYL